MCGTMFRISFFIFTSLGEAAGVPTCNFLTIFAFEV